MNLTFCILSGWNMQFETSRICILSTQQCIMGFRKLGEGYLLYATRPCCGQKFRLKTWIHVFKRYYSFIHVFLRDFKMFRKIFKCFQLRLIGRRKITFWKITQRFIYCSLINCFDLSLCSYTFQCCFQSCPDCVISVFAYSC